MDLRTLMTTVAAALARSSSSSSAALPAAAASVRPAGSSSTAPAAPPAVPLEALVGAARQDAPAGVDITGQRVFLALLNVAHQTNMAVHHEEQQQQQQGAGGGGTDAGKGDAVTLQRRWAGGVVRLVQRQPGLVDVVVGGGG